MDATTRQFASSNSFPIHLVFLPIRSPTSTPYEEKIAMLRENESFHKENDRLKKDKQSLLKIKEMSDTQVAMLTKSLETLQKDIKDRENLVQDLKKTLESQRTELNDCRAEITSLKMHIEGAQSGKFLLASDKALLPSLPFTSPNKEKEIPQNEIEMSKAKNLMKMESMESVKPEKVSDGAAHNVEDPQWVNDDTCPIVGQLADLDSENTRLLTAHDSDDANGKPEKLLEELLSSSGGNEHVEKRENSLGDNGKSASEIEGLVTNSDNLDPELNAEKMGLEAIQILSNALPKIVPYVLINHQEKLLPLIMCAIERHPDSHTRDSLTHTLFNLIKCPDE